MVAGTAGILAVGLTFCSYPASGRAKVDSLADWTLSVELDYCAANVRKLMRCLMELYHVAYTEIEQADSHCIDVGGVDRRPVAYRSCCSSFLLGLERLMVPQGS